MRAVFMALALAQLTAACERPPVGGARNEPPPEGRIGPVAFELFVQDRPAIAGKWFDYDPSGHTLDPKAEAWILRDESGENPRHAAFRIESIYEADRAESGLFTLSVALHDGSSWGPATPWVAPRNIKDGPPLCVDVFSGGELDCGQPGWQLRLMQFHYFAPLSGIAVSESGVFLASVAGTDAFGEVTAARIDDVTDLSSLPDPQSLTVLSDAPSPAWDTTDWAFGSLAPDLPEPGMAIGSRLTDGDVFWLMTSRFDLVRFSASSTADAIDFTFATTEVSREDWTTPDTMPADATAHVAIPPIGDVSWLTFDTPDLLVAAEHLEGTAWPYAPPKTTRFDLAVEHTLDGRVRILVSPAAALVNATELGLDTVNPPVSSL